MPFWIAGNTTSNILNHRFEMKGSDDVQIKDVQIIEGILYLSLMKNLCTGKITGFFIQGCEIRFQIFYLL